MFLYVKMFSIYFYICLEFDMRWKSFHVVKKTLENKLVGEKKHIRPLIMDRVMLQHEVRRQSLEELEFSGKNLGIRFFEKLKSMYTLYFPRCV